MQHVQVWCDVANMYEPNETRITKVDMDTDLVWRISGQKQILVMSNMKYETKINVGLDGIRYGATR